MKVIREFAPITVVFDSADELETIIGIQQLLMKHGEAQRFMCGPLENRYKYEIKFLDKIINAKK